MYLLHLLIVCVRLHLKSSTPSASSHLLLQHVNFALLDVQHVFEVGDLALLSAFLLRQLRYLLALFGEEGLLLLQTQTEGIHLCTHKHKERHYGLKSVEISPQKLRIYLICDSTSVCNMAALCSLAVSDSFRTSTCCLLSENWLVRVSSLVLKANSSLSFRLRSCFACSI